MNHTGWLVATLDLWCHLRTELARFQSSTPITGFGDYNYFPWTRSFSVSTGHKLALIKLHLIGRASEVLGSAQGYNLHLNPPCQRSYQATPSVFSNCSFDLIAFCLTTIDNYTWRTKVKKSKEIEKKKNGKKKCQVWIHSPRIPVSLRPANRCMALTALVTDVQAWSWPVEGSGAGR